MANGDSLSTARAKGISKTAVGYKLLDAQATIADGPWVDTRALGSGSVEVFGTFTGVVQLRGSNQDAQPASDYEGSQLGSNITGPAIVAVGMPVRWIKAIVTGISTGAVSANFHATS